jgi:S-sulfo-L-cysteine synthase (3-phospho-L-serine-dependent)
LTPVTTHGDAVEAMSVPTLVELAPGLFAAAFPLMKVLPARHILDRAEEEGELGPGVRVIETTSGTLGLGLAMLCRLRGYELTVVGDPVIDRSLRRRMEMLGTEVEIVAGKDLEQGVQQARLARVEQLCAQHPRHFVPRQYDNPRNPEAYASLAAQLSEALGPIDALVATVGSGGSSCGTARALRERGELELIGVDTPGSVLFGAADGERLLRGLGSSIFPANVDQSAFDEVHWVGAAEAFLMARILFVETCLFMGPTSGAAYLVARWWARRHPGKRIVALFPDEGCRYQHTVFDEEWLRRNGAMLEEPPSEPRTVDDPHDVEGSGWSRCEWGRRSLAEVGAQG